MSIGQSPGVTYCIKPNSTATCRPEDDCQHCQTLQHYFDNIKSIIDEQKNATMIFMEGSHTADISSVVTITAPLLNMIARGQSTRVRLRSVCQDVNSCNLTFKSTHMTMENFKVALVRDDLRFHIDFNIAISANKVYFNECILIFHSSAIALRSYTVAIPYATDVLLKHCTFYDSIHLNTSNKYIANTISNYTGTPEIKALNITLNHSTFTSSFLEIADAKYAVLEGCKFEGFFGFVYISDSTTVILNKYKFLPQDQDNIWEFYSHGINTVLKDCYLKNVVAHTDNCKVNITGDSVLTASIIHSDLTSITMSGNISIENYRNLDGAVFPDSSNLTIAAGADVTFSNNSALNSGGAPLLMFSGFYIEAGASVKFVNNSAQDKGGAIYAQPGISSVVHGISALPCLSSISSDPQRACLCDSHGMPQCSIVYNTKKIHPGESFTVSAVIVGWDYQNTTTGVVHVNFVNTGSSAVPILDSNSQRGHVISNGKQCTNLTFILYSKSLEYDNVHYSSAYGYPNSRRFLTSQNSVGDYRRRCITLQYMYTLPF